MQSKTSRITNLMSNQPKRLDLYMTLPYMMPEDLKRQLVAQEARSREQLSSLAETAAAREAEASELRLRAQQLQEQCDEKEAAMARLYREMETAQKQSELLQQKLRQLEEDIAGFKRYNAQLTQELQAQQEAQHQLQQQQQLRPQKRSEQDEHEDEDEDSSTASETEDTEDTEDEDERRSKLHKMEEELNETRARLSEREAHGQELAAAAARAEAALAAAAAERDALNTQRERLLQERKEEMGIVQKALEEAQAESAAARRCFEKDFERLRTVHSDRETQLLEDFEWKLREVQQACKRRIEDKEKTAEARVQKTRQELEQRLASAERRLADLYDTQRALRTATKDVERAHDSERRLKEEVQRLGQLVETERSFAATLQRKYDRLVAETERKLETRAQELQDELTEQWEQKARGECARLREELAQLHAEEVTLAVAAAKSEAGSAAEAEYDERFKAIERRATKALNEVTSLRARMAEKESEHARELETTQSRCDSTLLELRRKLDKLDMQYQEKIEKLQEEHEKQIERMAEEQERRVAQVEAAWQAQASSTRATLELVKEQLERDAETRLEALERKHQKALEDQWERLNAEHERTLEETQNRHREQLERLRKDLERMEEHQQHQQKEQQHQQLRQPKDKETAGLMSADRAPSLPSAIIQSRGSSRIPSPTAGAQQEGSTQTEWEPSNCLSPGSPLQPGDKPLDGSSTEGRGGDPAAADADAGGPTGDSDSEGGNCQFAPEHPTTLVGAEQFPERMQGDDNCGNNERADVVNGFQLDPDRIPECTDTERFAQRTDSSLYGDGEYTDATDADITEGGFSDSDVTEHADIGIITDAETEDEDFIRARYSERSGAPGEHPEEPTPNSDTGYYTGVTDGRETTGPIKIDGNTFSNLGDIFESGSADGDPEGTDISRDLTYDGYNPADGDNTRGYDENAVGHTGGETNEFQVTTEPNTASPVDPAADTNSRGPGRNHKGRKGGGKGGDGGPSGGPGGGGPPSGQRTPRPQRKARKARRRARPANTNAAPQGAQPRNPH